MARRKKKKKQVSLPKLSSNLSPEISREIVAILLALLALLLGLAAVGIGGSLSAALFGFLRQGIGYSAYLLPVVLALIVWMLFQPEKYEPSTANYVGFTGVVLALSG